MYGSPACDLMLVIRGGADVIIIEIKGTISVMCFNHPKTILPPTQSMEKLSSAKPDPGAVQVWDCCVGASYCLL